MKVLYLKLDNFVNIYAGMKRNSVEIDLSKAINKLIILAGPNASGKTSILSELHPFANSGNMDVRSDTCLIKEGCDGYKEIHIQDGDDIYVIKHNYLYKNKTKSVKSFISKNGVELNSNGNVKTFKEAVFEHLGLDQSLLKLMRLGSNVTNLVDLKSTNRKSFATKLFSDLEIYGGFLKNVSAECRNNRALLKNLSEKISKYNITDESEFEKQIANIAVEMDRYSNLKENLIKETASLENKIKDIDISDESLVRDRVMLLEAQLSEAESLLTLVQSINMSRAEYELMKEKEKNALSTEINKVKSNMDLKILERDNLYSKRQELDEKIKSAVSDIRLNDITKSLKKYTDEVNSLEKKLEGRVRYDKEGLYKFKDHLDKTLRMISDLGHYSIYDIKRIASAVLDNQNIKEFIEARRGKLNKDYEKINAEIINIENISLELEKFDIPENACKSDCPYKAFYYRIMGRKESLGDLIEERNNINKELTASEELYNLHSLILVIVDFVDEFDYDGPLPVEFNSNIVLEAMSQNKAIVNKNLVNLAIDDSESFERIDSLKKEIELLNKEFDMIKEYSIDVIEVENQIMDIDEKVGVINVSIQESEGKINDLTSELKTIENEVENIVRALDMKDKLSDIEDEHMDKKRRLDEIEELKTLKNTYSSELISKRNEMLKVSSFLNGLVSRKEQMNYNLKDYRNLVQEHEAISLLFKEANEVREALNTSGGIPVVYLNVYLKNCPTMMNALLKSNSSLTIEDFVINDDEFAIPYRKNGLLAPDILMTSQGERSFVSIVLSLSLIVQSMTKYNIICLDELDGPLDTNNREEFIKILYSFINMVGCEQVFLITHNNMFDNEPVDIIQTGNIDIDSFRQGNVIFKA